MIDFVPHCDEGYCDLGSFHYTCPLCHEYSVDYDFWWHKNDIYDGIPHELKCDKCDKDLIVWKDPGEGLLIGIKR